MAARGPAATHEGFPCACGCGSAGRPESGPTRLTQQGDQHHGPAPETPAPRRHPVSATNINRVTLTGNLTRDPELRSTQSGTSVCSMRIACNTRRKSGDGWVDKPNYFNVTVWGAQGENCHRYLG